MVLHDNGTVVVLFSGPNVIGKENLLPIKLSCFGVPNCYQLVRQLVKAHETIDLSMKHFEQNTDKHSVFFDPVKSVWQFLFFKKLR